MLLRILKSLYPFLLTISYHVISVSYSSEDPIESCSSSLSQKTLIQKSDLRKELLKHVFVDILRNIGQNIGEQGPTCFISRVYLEDKGIHSFVNTFHQHLNLAGVHADLDEHDLQIGEDIHSFVQRIHSHQFTVVVFTPNYKKRASYTDTWIHQEMSAIDSKIKSGNSRFYVPILLEGDPFQSIPTTLNPKGRLFADFRNESWYMYNFLDLLDQKILYAFRNPLEAKSSDISGYRGYRRNFTLVHEHAEDIADDFIQQCESSESKTKFENIKRLSRNNVEQNQRSSFISCFCRLLTYATALSALTTQKLFMDVHVETGLSLIGANLALPSFTTETYTNPYINLLEDDLTEDDLMPIKQAADKGDSSAQFEFATLLKRRGNSIEHDIEKYITYLHISADNGYSMAQFELAMLYESGNEAVEKNHERFMHYLKLAAENGHKVAKRKFEKQLQEEKCGGKQGIRNYIEKLHQQAEDRNVAALYRLSQLYKFGECLVTEDRKQYFYYLKLAAEGGSDDAQFEMGALYQNKTNDLVKQDDNKVFYYLTRAADSGHIAATFILVDLYAEKRDTHNLIKYLKALSDNGYSFAQYRLAKIYDKGMHVIGGRDLASNEKLYESYLLLVANNKYDQHELHITNAQYELAKLYERGRGSIKKDMILCEEYLKRAANSGHKSAPYELAKLYENGSEQIKKNVSEYERYIKMAAARGHEIAKKELATLRA